MLTAKRFPMLTDNSRGGHLNPLPKIGSICVVSYLQRVKRVKFEHLAKKDIGQMSRPGQTVKSHPKCSQMLTTS